MLTNHTQFTTQFIMPCYNHSVVNNHVKLIVSLVTMQCW